MSLFLISTFSEVPMRDTRPSASGRNVLFAVFAILVAYAAGYFLLGDAWRPGPPPGPHPIRMRVFPNSFFAAAYRPAAWIESRIRGGDIVAGDPAMLARSSP